MSDSLVPAGSSAMANAPSAGASHEYALSSDLAKLSLPAEYVDSYRNLAWANSICFLFLVIGLIGLKAPKVIHKPLIEVTESAPVIFTPPEDQPKPEPEVQPDEPAPQDAPVETPQVVTVAAPADAQVAFAALAPPPKDALTNHGDCEKSRDQNRPHNGAALLESLNEYVC